MKKILLLIISVMIMATILSACSTKKDNTLVIGMELAYPPFETKDNSGDATGISADLAKALGEYLSRPVLIENTAWDGLIPSLQTGKVDMVISSMTITDERSKVVDFSIPYAHAYLALLTNKASNINSIEDLNLNGKTIAVKTGTTGYIYANTHLKNATINAFSSENACVTEVTQGKADAFIYDELTIYRQFQKNPDTTKAVMISPQEGERWGIAVKSGNTQLLKQINSFIQEYKDNGGFEKLTDKYLSQEKKTFDELGFPWFFD